MKIQDYLNSKKLIIDGAMGTYYSRLAHHDNVVSEFANISDPDSIIKIHKEYIKSGAGLIRTNSFAANRQVLKISKEEQLKIITASYHLAVQAVQESTDKVFIACDIGPIPDNREQLEHATETDTLEEYQFICDTFLELKPEIILFETFPDLRYIKHLVPYIKAKSPELFILTSFCLNKNGYSSSGISATALIKEIACTEGIDAIGFNCGIGSGHMLQIIKNLHLPANKYILIAPNAGYPEQYQNRMVFMDNKRYFGTNLKCISDLGVDIIGGCCGTTPEYIREISKQINTSDTNRGKRVYFNQNSESHKELRKNEFYELFRNDRKVVAVELDPPFNSKDENIIACTHKLKELGADIITIADSPMGRSRVDSILMSIKITRETGMPAMPHVSCRDKNVIGIRSGLLGAYANGIRNLLIVTGDPIPSESRLSTTGVFDYNSIRLMQYVHDMNREHFYEEPFYYGGALNYNRGDIDSVIDRMNKKIAAGTKYFLTQPVFSEKDISKIQYIKSKVDTKILCGIMPLSSYRNAVFIKNEITGIYIPDSIVNRYHPDMLKEEAELEGAKIASEIIEQLSTFADGYYFMLPFNRVSFMEKIQIIWR